MIRVAVCNVENLNLDRALNKVSQKRREKVKGYRFLKDQKLSCGAQLLLNKMLFEENVDNPEYAEDFYGKPYVDNYDVEFNLSHSRQMVACAVSDKSVGIDIEYVDNDMNMDIARHYFYNEEYENIILSKNKTGEFFKYWVLKESFMKYTGLGFNINLNEFNIKVNEDDIRVLLKNREKTLGQIEKNRHGNISLDDVNFTLFDLDDYVLAVSGREEVEQFGEIDVNELY